MGGDFEGDAEPGAGAALRAAAAELVSAHRAPRLLSPGLPPGPGTAPQAWPPPPLPGLRLPPGPGTAPRPSPAPALPPGSPLPRACPLAPGCPPGLRKEGCATRPAPPRALQGPEGLPEPFPFPCALCPRRRWGWGAGGGAGGGVSARRRVA